MAGLALGATGIAAAAQPPRLRVTLPFGSHVKHDAVIGIVIELDAATPFTGTLVVRPDAHTGTQVPRPLNLGPGRFRYELAYPFTAAGTGEEAVRVELRNAGDRLVDEQRLPLQLLTATPPTGQSADAPEADHGPRLIAWLGAQGPPAQLGGALGANATACWLKPADAPRDWRLFAAVDLLLIA